QPSTGEHLVPLPLLCSLASFCPLESPASTELLTSLRSMHSVWSIRSLVSVWSNSSGMCEAYRVGARRFPLTCVRPRYRLMPATLDATFLHPRSKVSAPRESPRDEMDWPRSLSFVTWRFPTRQAVAPGGPHRRSGPDALIVGRGLTTRSPSVKA